MRTGTAVVRLKGKPLKPSSNWRDILDAFIVSLDVRESSRELYRRTLRLYFEWLGAEGKLLKDIDRTDILQYKDTLFAKGLSPLSVASYLTALKEFYTWTEAQKLYPNVANGIKTPHRKQTFRKQHLTEEKSRELLDYFEGSDLRDFAIVNLLLRTGLRTIELVRANIEDITYRGDRRILKVWGKGRDDRDNFVILTDKAYKPIQDYLSTSRRGANVCEPLFVSDSHRNEGGRLTTRTISGICKTGLRAVGLDSHSFTAHSLRHTTAVEILKRGGNLSQAQAVLRHTNPNTTQIYVESIKEDLRLQNAPETLLDNAF